jgi:hypothetical protein
LVKVVKTSSPSRPGGSGSPETGFDDLREEVIVGDVKAIARLAFAGDPGADDLGETVDVERDEVERSLERGPNPVGPWLGAEHPDPQAELAGLPALLGERLGEMEREGRRRRDHIRPEVLQQQMMPRGISRRDRHDGHPDALGAVVEAEAAGEEPVAEGDVQQVATARAGGRQRARHDFAPDVEVPGAIRGDGRLALGAGGRVDAGDLSTGHRQEAEGILLAKIRLANEWQTGQIRERADRGGAQPLAVKRDVLGGPAERCLKALELQALADRTRHGLGLGIPDQSGPTGAAGPPCAGAARGTAGPRFGGSEARWLRAGSGGRDGRGRRGLGHSRSRRAGVPAPPHSRPRRAAG